MSSISTVRSPSPRPIILLIVVSVVATMVAFNGPIRELVRRWVSQEEYSHGFLIPIVTSWLLWQRRDALANSIGNPSWVGVIVIAVAGMMHVVGGLGALFIVSQVGFVVALIGAVLCIGGHSLMRVAFVPIIFLLFAIPLPYFIDSILSWRLQLISSSLGTQIIQIFQIPVNLEGNVIDLGNYKLQVVEACSGLRYLYPLMSLGFLAAYMFQAPIWQRAVVFLSTIPITVLMNSLRIGIVGVIVSYSGPQDADGFLHMFEGWIIFICCALLIFGEIYALTALTSRKSLFEVLRAPVTEPITPAGRSQGWFPQMPLIAGLLLLCATATAGLLVSNRAESFPDRASFAGFPNTLGDWRGRQSSLEPQTEHFLGLTDYILSDYRNPRDQTVNFYVAYYATQRSGLSPHSPSVCIPGNGWQITKLDRISYQSKKLHMTIPVNRVVIQRETSKELVYYWFEQRGRKVANEWLSKYYLLSDAIFHNRTDGALVRFVTPVSSSEEEQDADHRIQEFVDRVVPHLTRYLPSEINQPTTSFSGITDHLHNS
jgi:exosortase D (VPLPA-CTERM-specific)